MQLKDKLSALGVQAYTPRELLERTFRLLVYGEPGAGKTTLIGTAESGLVFDFESGAGVLPSDGRFVVIDAQQMTFGELLAAIDKVRSIPHPELPAVVAFDGLSQFADHLLEEAEREVRSRLGGRDPRDYRMVYAEQTKLVKRLLRRIASIGRPTILTALVAVDRDEKGEVIRVRPRLTPSVGAQVLAWADAVGFLRVEEDGQRYLYFKQTSGLYVLKNRCPGDLAKEEPRFPAILAKARGEVKPLRRTATLVESGQG